MAEERCNAPRAGCERTQRGVCLLHHVPGEGHVLHGAADVARGGCAQLPAPLHHLRTDTARQTPRTLPGEPGPVAGGGLGSLRPVPALEQRFGLWGVSLEPFKLQREPEKLLLW